jgi:hypothetical protein
MQPVIHIMTMFSEFLDRWNLIVDGPPVVTPTSGLLPVLWGDIPAMLKVALGATVGDFLDKPVTDVGSFGVGLSLPPQLPGSSSYAAWSCHNERGRQPEHVMNLRQTSAHFVLSFG